MSVHFKMGVWRTHVVPLALSLRPANVNSSHKSHVKGIVVMVHNSLAVNTAIYIGGTGLPRDLTYQMANTYHTIR